MDRFEPSAVEQHVSDVLTAARDDDCLAFAPQRDVVAGARKRHARRRTTFLAVAAAGIATVGAAGAVAVAGAPSSRLTMANPTDGGAPSRPLPAACRNPDTGTTDVVVTAEIGRRVNAMGDALCRYAATDGSVTQLEEWTSLGGLAGGYDGLTYDEQITYMAGNQRRIIWVAVWRPHDAVVTKKAAGPTVSEQDHGTLLAVWPDGTHVHVQGGVWASNGSIDRAPNPALLRHLIKDPIFDAFAGEPMHPVANLWSKQQYADRQAALQHAIEAALPDLTVTPMSESESVTAPAEGRLHGTYSWNLGRGTISGHVQVTWKPDGGADASGLTCPDRADGTTCYTGTLGDGTGFRVQERCSTACTSEEVEVWRRDGTKIDATLLDQNGLAAIVVPAGDALVRALADPALSAA